MVALVVEDGSVVSGANSYVTLAYVDEYITNYFPEAVEWDDYSNEQKNLFIVRATKFLDNLVSWNSVIKDTEQSLAFPRRTFDDKEGRVVSGLTIPVQIKEAAATLSLQASRGNLSSEFAFIIQESLGSTSDTYSSPVRVDGNDLVRSVYMNLIGLGYGKSKSSIVILERA